ncbi:DUF6596 domain-containing protein [Nonomuraea soli]|uniref:RNA polymerase sigma factor n=1 Tax=Nonomuraea soli TaxID=1032476 RepID=A0A7W0CQ03_9ACTN|nr:DUF6596 domain-containing protein [Nonomuraea soli]MBA2895236.1 RNA polymerase sigma factor (sigma-70 family) [Nonomuraea soli]
MDAARTVDAVWKFESAKIIAGLTRLVHDVGLAEELAQDALVAALEQWPESGVPGNPGAWLMTIAKRRAIDHLRRTRRLQPLEEERRESRDPDADPDDVLRLMFLSCHPVLPTTHRVALTLRLLGGLTAGEIARAFLVTEQTVTQRIADAKRLLAAEQVAFDLPAGPELADRLSSVLGVVYLIFNEGYSATSGDDLMRPGLVHEALRLGRLLAELAPSEAEVHGLVALMEIQASRSAARTGPSGEPVQLHEQNRGRWDQLLIRRGFQAMLRARATGGTPGPYMLQAAIAVTHAQARGAAETDWARIAALYDLLVRLLPTPVVHLNRAVAVGMAHGPAAGLDLVEPLLSDPALRDYHLLPSVRGDLLERLGRHAEARVEFTRAAALTRNAAERDFLLRRADATGSGQAAGHLRPEPGTLGQAAQRFLASQDLTPATVRSYTQTLTRLRRSLGDRLPLTGLTPAHVSRVFTTTWQEAAPSTWNRHRATVRSFSAWLGGEDLAALLPRRREEPRAHTPVDNTILDELHDLPLRERTLWHLLRESGAPVTTVLALNVEDLDLDDRTASNGVSWRKHTARLLPALIAGRPSGPLFLTDRRAGPGATDVCPHTGRRRLSYERAEYLFKQASGGLTLSRLRRRAGQNSRIVINVGR